MALTEMTRRSFVKLTAVATAAASVGITAETNLSHTEKAYAEDEIVQQKTFCRACPRACGAIAYIQNGRVLKVKGNPDDIFSHGAMCPKGLSGVQALYHPNRTKYPMKRVGERGVDNTWERISWDEAIDMIAHALADMRDKYGRNGYLGTTGGGGNPKLFDVIAFRDYWGAGNVFEPGAAQCAMPRDFIQKQMDGCFGYTSIGDGGCEGVFNPNVHCDTFVQWGAGACSSSTAYTGQIFNYLRDRGTFFINIDPRFTHDSARADIWLPIRPGTDTAMMLAWINYIITNKKYDEKFLLKWSNLPFLVNPDDPAGMLVRASTVKDIDVSAGEGFVYFDTVTNKVTKAFALSPANEGTYNPQLFGTVQVELADGRTVTCKTAGQALADSVKDWTMERAAEVCWVPLDKAMAAVEAYANADACGVGSGVSLDQYIQSAENAQGVALLNILKGGTMKKGCPNCNMPRFDGQYTLGKEKGRYSNVSYKNRAGFDPNVDDQGKPLDHTYITHEGVVERLGYIEHKGLGHWKHSQIPAVYDAIMSGEPYQPRVWYERSGNKMATIADSASWIAAIKKMDFISHTYMYPTSFTFEAADVLLPCTEWLESAYNPGNHGDLNGDIVDCTLLFEHCDDRFIYGTIFKKLADKYNDQNAYNVFYVDKQYYSIYDYDEYLQDMAVKGMSWEETKKINGWRNSTEEEFWAACKFDDYLKVDSAGLYTGMTTYPTTAPDIKDNPRKDQAYMDRLIYIGRHGIDITGELPAASADYSPVPFYHEPIESPLDSAVKTKYPLVCSNGRLPYFHHTTLRNNPYLRETYPIPELWIAPDAAAERGIENGDWVNVKSQRCEEQEIIKDGIFAKAFVTPGINPGCVYMERFWNPEFLEECKDARKSWTTCNYNVLSRREGPYNPVMGTYTLRGVPVQVSKASKPDGVWCEPEDFEPWMPQPSDNTGGGYGA